MKGKRKSAGILLYALVAVLILGVGYATINAIGFTINGSATATPNSENFTVVFDDTATNTITSTFTHDNVTVVAEQDPKSSTATVDATDKHQASFTIYGYTTKDQYADVTFTVKNTSPDMKAKLCESSIQVSGGSSTTFTSTATITGAATVGEDKCITLNANGGTTTIVVRTTLNATPATENITADNIVVSFNAEPVANS